ncbi:hypothetical protein I79_017116 [Cricetulus griseus]|uniref:Uncharacterized protein n=1 Tax=Cricetulus griseus TaxID=10029 RepID=G3I170_CRIGR|nr:hypothetical protein I79_017116 [Cricetulus griseus]
MYTWFQQPFIICTSLAHLVSYWKHVKLSTNFRGYTSTLPSETFFNLTTIKGFSSSIHNALKGDPSSINTHVSLEFVLNSTVERLECCPSLPEAML